jgi:hypothetical protein
VGHGKGAGLNMDARMRDMIAITLVAAFCAGVAVAFEQQLFVPVFLAMSALAGIAAFRRSV